jgi:hypothetical protein
MARKKDVAGLAALAGLGLLMANRKKQGAGGVSERQITADREANDQQTSGDKEDMFVEPGSGPHGQKFDDELPSASAPAAVKPTVKPSGGGGGAAAPTPAPALKPMSERYQPAAARPNPNFGNEGRQKPVGQTSVSANQIPGQSAKAPQGGERVDSNEIERNINAIGAATGIGGAAGLAYKGKKMYDASKAAKAAGEVASKGREAVTNPLSWMAGPKNAGKFKEEAAEASKSAPGMFSKAKDAAKEAAEKFADRFRKKPMSEADTTGGAIGYKRGGKVRGYAGGGSVSSASSRGDGIATKGKTRGKIY